MASEIEDGGPAFPYAPPIGADGLQAALYPYPDSGMSLRDWFAGQTLSSIPLRNWDSDNKSAEEVIKQWAACAYMVADAMLEARGASHGK